MIAIPQATAALYVYLKIYKIFSEFNRYLLIFSKNKQKSILWQFVTVCEIFFKLKFIKTIQNISTLQNLGRFLFIVWLDIPKIMNLLTDLY